MGSVLWSNTKQMNKKSTGLGPQGAGVFNRWAARLDENPDQLLSMKQNFTDGHSNIATQVTDM